MAALNNECRTALASIVTSNMHVTSNKPYVYLTARVYLTSQWMPVQCGSRYFNVAVFSNRRQSMVSRWNVML